MNREWNSRYYSEYVRRLPWLEDLVGYALATKVEAEEIRAELSIAPDSERDRELFAFYLGCIAGDLSRYPGDISSWRGRSFDEAVALIALVTAVWDESITGDDEWEALARRSIAAFTEEKYSDFRGLGRAYRDQPGGSAFEKEKLRVRLRLAQTHEKVLAQEKVNEQKLAEIKALIAARRGK